MSLLPALGDPDSAAAAGGLNRRAGPRWARGSAAPLRDAKKGAYPGGIHEPAAATGPALLPGHVVEERLELGAMTPSSPPSETTPHALPKLG